MKKKPSGSAKMLAKGKKASLIWFDVAELDRVKRAAQLDGCSAANFIKFHAITAALMMLDRLDPGRPQIICKGCGCDIEKAIKDRLAEEGAPKK